MVFARFTSVRGLLFLLAGLMPAAFAQLPTARLLTVFPTGGQAGSTTEVSVSGIDLEGTNRMSFSHPGITAKAEGKNFKVTIAAEVPPGVYDARVAGRYGISNPRAFAVGGLVEQAGPATNRSPANAAEVRVPVTINGRAETNAAGFFKFSSKRGERVLIECAARGLDSRLDPVLVLSDESGRELERNRRGGLVDFLAPEDGMFVLKLHDQMFRGGPEFFYRLTLGRGPRIDFIFPPAGVPGARSQFIVYGRGLPGGAPASGFTIEGKVLEQIEVNIEMPENSFALQRLSINSSVKPSEAFVDAVEYRLKTERGASDPVLLGLAGAPVVLEHEPNSKAEAAQKISPPCEVAGQFYPAGDRDWFTFDAKKGDVFWIEVFSQRLGWPTSPFLLVQRAVAEGRVAGAAQEVYGSDANIGGNEFKTGTLDPATRFEAKEDGTWRVQVRDLFNRHESDPRFVYRLAVRREAPDFRLFVLPQSPAPGKDKKDVTLWTPFLRRGETTPVKVLALRRDGFSGEIQLRAEGLPDGVRCAEAKIEAGKTSGSLLFTAADDAGAWAGSVRILGQAKAGEKELVREARGGSMTWSVADPAVERIQSRLTRDFALAVSGEESAPVSIAPAEAKIWEAKAGGKVQIPLRVTQRGGFSSALKLKASGLAALDSMKEFDVDAKATNATLTVDLAAQKLPPGRYTFHLQSQATGKYRGHETGEKAKAKDVTLTVYSAPIQLRVLPAEKK